MSEPKSTGRKPGHNASKKGFVASPPVKPIAPTPSKLTKDTSKKDIAKTKMEEDEIVWTSKVTSDMTSALKDDTIDEFVKELNDCVMQLCIEFGVHGDQSTRAKGSNNRRTIWSSTITRNMVSGLPSHMVEGVIEALNTNIQAIWDDDYCARIEKIDGRVLDL